MRSFERALLSLIVVLTLASTDAWGQQSNVQSVVGQMIFQLQAGAPNPTWYGPDLWNTICAQTGCTGRYPQLVQLGSVQNVDLNGSTQLPAGVVYSLTAHQAYGLSQWMIGIGSVDRRILYMSFCTCATRYVLPASAPPPAPSPPRTDDNNPPPPPAGKRSAGCEKFPNLCP